MGWRLMIALPPLLVTAAVAAPGTVPAETVGDPVGARAVEVVAEAKVYGLGKTPEEARREALQRAREEAVARVAGIDVTAQQMRLRSEASPEGLDGFSSLIRTTTSGRIVREEVVYRTAVEDDVPVYFATLRADVVLEERARDPGFTLDVRTVPDSPTIRDGESVSLEITSSRRCYLTLLNVLSDGTVTVLFPNERAGDNLVPAGETLRLPDVGDEFRILAHLGRGRRREHEQILAVATLDSVPLVLEREVEPGRAKPAGEMERTVTALNRWLLAIPVERRAEVLWSYEIVP
jgi:hypothetical protein